MIDPGHGLLDQPVGREAALIDLDVRLDGPDDVGDRDAFVDALPEVREQSRGDPCRLASAYARLSCPYTFRRLPAQASYRLHCFPHG